MIIGVMDKNRFHSPVVAAAIDKAGGVASVARALGISYQSVYEWYVGKRRLPGFRCIQVANMADMEAEALRPDLADYWRAIREAA